MEYLGKDGLVEGEKKPTNKKFLIFLALFALAPCCCFSFFGSDSKTKTDKAPIVAEVEPIKEVVLTEEEEAERLRLEGEAEEAARIEDERVVEGYIDEDIKYVKDNFPYLTKKHCTTKVPGILSCAKNINLLANYIFRILNSGTESQKSQGESMLKTMSQRQKKLLPAMRNAYGPAIHKVLWENDVGAKISGKDYRVVAFWGAPFAANKNIAEFQRGIQDALVRLRFKHVRYTWYEKQREYTQYTLEPPKDEEVVIWSGEGSSYTDVNP